MTFAVAGARRTGSAAGSRDSAVRLARAALVVFVVMLAVPAGARAEQASEPSAAVAGQLDAGGQHTCSLDAGAVRCWGANLSGQLGYGIEDSVGDNENAGAAGPVNLGPGRFATAISAGDFHPCALLDNGSVRCWGFGGDGRLGYANQQDIGDDESPAAVGPVNLGRSAKAISAGGAHTCAVLDNGSVLCWGFGENGRLGYGDPATIGDDETPGSLAPVQLGRPATAISAGGEHTCALLDDRSVRCWGSSGSLFGGDGRLGYGTPETSVLGDNEVPASVGPVALGAGATAISAGAFHTCAVLDGGSVRCWGNAADGRLGYANNEARVGDNETPGSVGPVDLGGPAAAISVSNHTCARLTSGALRCWGPGSFGRLGYANTNNVGDDEAPGARGPVDIGGAAVAVSAGGTHTCAKLGDLSLRCWGEGAFGRLGYANENNIGDDETPAAAGPVDLMIRGAPGAPPIVQPPAPAAPAVDSLQEALRRQAARSAALRRCRASAASKLRTAQSRARRRYRSPRVRARVLRQIAATATRERKRCTTRFGLTPGRVTSIVARRRSPTAIVLEFGAPGTDGSNAPAARGYVVKQSLRPIRTARDFERAKALCGGTCRFNVLRPGDDIKVNVTRLRRRTTYHYAVAALDNVSARRGARSKTVSIRTG
jgi:alpha-tubulin suppressor-like RCC1 family protein